ncbi:hypothetical protein ONZ45_g14078 [Pleurotus djamor]|nr:hypothetical protein ONZ45_g14078 [Pleurotus djamor]
MKSQPLGLLRVPWEVIKIALQLSEVPDLLAFIHSCRHLRDLASSDIEIQYMIEAFFAGAHVIAKEELDGDGRPRLSEEISLKDRLDLIRRRENSWDTLRPTSRQSLKLKFDFGNVHGFRNGVLELGRSSPFFYQQNDYPPALSLKYALLSTKGRGLSWKEWKEESGGGRISGTCVALHESDLLVVVTSTDDPAAFDSRSCVHFVQLTTGLPHPQVTAQHLEVVTHFGTPSISSSVLGAHVALLYTFEPTEDFDDLLLVLNWMTGKTILVMHIHGEPSPSQSIEPHSSAIPPALRDDPEKALISFVVLINRSKFFFVARRSGLVAAAESLRMMEMVNDDVDDISKLPDIPYGEWAPNNVRWIHANEHVVQWSMRHHGQRMVVNPRYSEDHPLLLYDFNPYHVKKWTSKQALDESSKWAAPPPFWWNKSPLVLPTSPLVVYRSTTGLPFTDQVPEMPYVCYQSEERFIYQGKAGKKLFEKHMEQYAPSDPMYEFYLDESGNQRRRKRELPPGLSKRDAKILRAVNTRASRLDRGFSLCGLRFGWTFFIGLIPIVGDVTNICLNYFFVVRKAKQAELPSWLVRRMGFNNAVSGAISFIPLVGDVLLAVWKANSRNAALLEEFLRIRGEEFIKIRAEGGDPDKIQKENAKAARKKKGKDSAKSTPANTTAGPSKEIAPGVTKNDAKQVKPGAGRETGETLTGGGRVASPLVEGASANGH